MFNLTPWNHHPSIKKNTVNLFNVEKFVVDTGSLAQWITFANCGVSMHRSQIYGTSSNIKDNSTAPSNVGHTMIARRVGMHKFIFQCSRHIKDQFLA